MAEQLEETLKALGGKEIWSVAGGNGVEARCRRVD